MVAFISAGFIQLFVGPASSSRSEQMNVRSSTRATSLGSEAAQNEFGFFASRTSVPAATRWVVNSRHSSSDPSHQYTRSGVVSAATSRTHSSRSAWVVGAWSSPGTANVMATPLCAG